MMPTFHNRPFPSCFKPHCKSEDKCKVFIMKISFHPYANKMNFHTKSFALSLAFVTRFTTKLENGIFPSTISEKYVEVPLCSNSKTPFHLDIFKTFFMELKPLKFWTLQSTCNHNSKQRRVPGPERLKSACE